MSRPSTRTSAVLSGDKVFGPTDVVLVVPTNLRSHKTCNVTDVSQRAALAAVSGDLAAGAEMRPAFDRRRLVMHSMLNEIDRVTWILPEGAFQAFLSVQGLHGRNIRGRRSGLSSELADLAIEEAKVAVVPGEAFGAPGYFRVRPGLRRDLYGHLDLVDRNTVSDLQRKGTPWIGCSSPRSWRSRAWT